MGLYWAYIGHYYSLRDLRSTQTTVEEEHSCVSVCVAVSYRQKKKENVSIEYEKQPRNITKHLFDPFCGTGYSVGRVIGPLSRGVSVFLCSVFLCSVFLCSVFCALCSVLPTDPRVWASRGMYCPESEWEDSERQVEDSIKAGSKKKKEEGRGDVRLFTRQIE